MQIEEQSSVSALFPEGVCLVVLFYHMVEVNNILICIFILM